MTATDTKSRILDSAERLFAEDGFSATSLRSIIADAGVNLAAVHYHFGSKDELIRELLGRFVRPINRLRLEQLDKLEASAGGDAIPVEAIIEAFVAPPVQLSQDPDRGAVFRRLLGHAEHSPLILLKPFLPEFYEVGRRFAEAFQRTLPDLPLEEIYWRIHFIIGTMINTMAYPQRLECLSDGLCHSDASEGTLERLIGFLAAGMKTPVPSYLGTGKRPRTAGSTGPARSTRSSGSRGRNR